MKKEEIIAKLKEVLNQLNEGLSGEWDGFEGTDDQPDCRLSEASIELEDIIKDLEDEENE